MDGQVLPLFCDQSRMLPQIAATPGSVNRSLILPYQFRMSMIICWMRMATIIRFKTVKAKESPCSLNKGIHPCVIFG